MKIAFIRPSMLGKSSKDAMMPLVFAIIKPLTPKDIEIKFFDERIETIPENLDADIIAMTVETFSAKRAYILASKYKTEGKKIIMGGFHPTMLPDECLEYADSVIKPPVIDPPTTPPTPGNPYANLKVGDTVRLGNSDWRVYDVKNDRALVISINVLTTRSYHANRNDVTWANSDIRSWLNGSFYNNTFSSEEKKYISQTTITNANNQWNNTAGGSTTTDQIFLLSLEEVVQYFGNSGQLNAKQSSPINDDYNAARKSTIWWWLRSPGSSGNRASNINNNGFIDVGGDHVDNNNGGVRPALWLNII